MIDILHKVSEMNQMPEYELIFLFLGQFSVHAPPSRRATQVSRFMGPTQPSVFLAEDTTFNPSQSQASQSQLAPDLKFDPSSLSRLNEIRSKIDKHGTYGKPKVNILAIIAFKDEIVTFSTGKRKLSITLMDSTTAILNLILWDGQIDILDQFRRGDIVSISSQSSLFSFVSSGC